jgi:ABC-type multidrug transport system ATPase subunit
MLARTSSEPVLIIEGLHVRYGAFTAVDDLHLCVQRGELFGLLGPNGAGKTSTIRVLIGQCRPAQGRVSVCGLDVQRHWDRVKSHFGYVPDRENHFEELTGRRNLQVFCGLYNVPASRLDECLDLVELSEAGGLPVRGYSLGMRSACVASCSWRGPSCIAPPSFISMSRLRISTSTPPRSCIASCAA